MFPNCHQEGFQLEVLVDSMEQVVDVAGGLGHQDEEEFEDVGVD